MFNCCVPTVPPGSSYEAFAGPVKNWRAALTAGLDRSIHASDHNLGHIEEEIAQQTRELQRAIAQEAAQKKADEVPPTCPVCGAKLKRVTHGHKRTIQTRFGPITLKRSRGFCPQCERWFYPADSILGVDEGGTASPAVQEMAALLGSKMPISEASAVIRRLTGVDLPRPTLDREAKRQGRRAERKRDKLDEQMHTAAGAQAQGQGRSGQPFTRGTSASGMSGGKQIGSGPKGQNQSVGTGCMGRHAFVWKIG
jgi:transposase-like protein